MKATVKRLEMVEAMKAVAPFLAKSPLILHNVRLALSGRCNGLWLEIEACSGRQAVCFEVEATDAVDGDPVLVDHGRLASFLKADRGEEAALEVVGGRMVAKGHTKASFAVEAAEGWPVSVEWPEGGEGRRLERPALEEMARALPFVGRADYEHLIGRLLWVGEKGIFAGTPEAIWARKMGGLARIELFQDSARMVLGLAEGEGWVEVLESERRWWLRGASWRMTAAREEIGDLDPWRFLGSLPEPEVWIELPALSNLLPALEAVSSAMGERSTLRIDPDGAGGAKVSSWSDLVGAEGRIPGFPRWATYRPERLVAVLKELGRVAGTEGVIRVGDFGGGMLRLETEGATALVAGIKA